MHSLKALRRQSGLTLAELAQRTGASISLLSKFERGERTVSGKWVKLIANALSIKETDIMGDNVRATQDISPGVPWYLGLSTVLVDTSEFDRLIPRGSTVYVEPEADMVDGEIYAIRIGSEIHVRRARLRDGPMRFEAESWSSSPSPIFLNKGLDIVGKVRGLALEIT